MSLYISFGGFEIERVNLFDTKKIKTKLEELDESDRISSLGIGRMNKKISFELLNSIPKGERRKRGEVIDNYVNASVRYNIVDAPFRRWVFSKEVSHGNYTENSSLCVDESLIEELKSFEEGRTFFKVLKDQYRDDNNHPPMETSFIFNNKFRMALNNLSKYCLDNHKDMSNELNNFIKWAIYWSLETIKRHKHLSIVNIQK